VAILPGGASILKTGEPPFHKLNKNDSKVGAVLYFVDLETGVYIKQVFPFDKSGGTTAGPSGVTLSAYDKINPCQARSLTGSPVVFPTYPQISTRVFVGDVLGRVFRIDVSATNPAQWSNVDDQGQDIGVSESVRLVHNLYQGQTHSQPFMNRFALALNPRGELILTGGTGNTLNVESYDSPNKIFALREVLDDRGQFQYFVHLYHAPLNKYTITRADGTLHQRQTVSYSGEKMTGDPLIVNGITYFTTFDVSHQMPPICGIPGEARLYGLNYNTSCTNALCNSPKGVNARVLEDQTPLKCCESGGCTGVAFTDAERKTASPQRLCNDLNYTVPALTTEAIPDQPNSFEYFRYHMYGPNTLSMGPRVSYTPGSVVTVPRLTDKGTSSTSATKVQSPGRMIIQVPLSMRKKADSFKKPPHSAVRVDNTQNASGLGGSMFARYTSKRVLFGEWIPVLE
ncbi:MAG: hypothetical protein AAGJ35_07470, partial [Myxococcota bacterium]